VSGRRSFRSINKIEGLLKEKVHLDSFVTRNRGDAFLFSGKITDPDLVIVAGGDGTFNEVINGILNPGNNLSKKRSFPLALIPLGTTNVLANELGIPHTIEDAVSVALTGTPRAISLGRINGRYFSLMAGVGYDGETVFCVNKSLKKKFGKGAYVFAGIKSLIKHAPSLLMLKTPKESLTGFSAVVGNTHFYGGGYQVTPKADIPLLDLCLLKSKTRKKLLRFVSGIIMNRHLDLEDVVYRKISKIEITSKEKVHVQIDGDYFGTLPVVIDVVKDAVHVVC
jgi:YegS/Rv2252/BmrU family lipid kinase